MKHSTPWVWWTLALACWVGCGGDHAADAKQLLPCAVERIVVERCQGCHGASTMYGAPMSLVSYQDFHAPVPGDTVHKVYEVISDHLHGKASQMPPLPNDPLPASELEVVENWLKHDAPAASGDECADGDAGVQPASFYSSLSEPPPDCKDFYDFRTHGTEGVKDTSPYALPASEPGSDAYVCFYFNAPWDPDSAALWMHPLVDNKKVVHHWILYGTDQTDKAPGTISSCGAAVPGAYFLTGWAPGGKDINLPTDVELELPSGSQAGLILQIHYNNPDGKAAKDRSGVRFCTTKKGTRVHQSSVNFTGTEAICLAPGTKKTVSGICDPRDDMGEINIIGVSPHMHKLGRHMKISVLRESGKEEVIFDEAFDFNAQLYHPLPEGKWVLHPGDRLQTDCTFQNDRTERVHFGERTRDEMCYGWVNAWPAGALSNDPNNVVNQVAGPFQQKNRCLNPVGILQSCNGLQDLQDIPMQ